MASQTDKLKSLVNNAFYDELGERWYTASDDPVALLRAEAKLKNPWVSRIIAQRLQSSRCRILDIGCGAGFLSHALAQEGHEMIGIDQSQESLEVARRREAGGRPDFRVMNAYELEFPQASFDVVCAMDFLEHVDDPERVIHEAARVLKPGGLFFFHTFNRGFLSWLIVIKGVEWFVRNTPSQMHVYPLLIKPRELEHWCGLYGLRTAEIRGIRPRILTGAFLKLLASGIVRDDFEFIFTRSQALGYAGYALRQTM